MSPTTRSVARTSTTCRHQPAIGEAVSIARLPSCGGQQSGRKGQAGPGGRSGGRRVAVSIALPSRMRASRPEGKWGEREGEGGHGCHGLTPPSRSVRGVAVSIVWCPSNPAGQGGQEREREGGDGHTCPSRSVRMLPAPTRSLNLASSCDERHSCEMTSSHARPVGEQVVGGGTTVVLLDEGLDSPSDDARAHGRVLLLEMTWLLPVRS